MNSLVAGLRKPKRRPHIRLNIRATSPWITIVAANGEPLLHSQGYASLDGARDAAKNLSDDTGWVIKTRHATAPPRRS